MHIGASWHKRTYSPAAPDMLRVYSLTSPQVFQVVQDGRCWLEWAESTPCHVQRHRGSRLPVYPAVG